MSKNRTRWLLLGLIAAVLTLPTLALPSYSQQTILVVSDFNAPGDTSGDDRHDDDDLVYYLGAGDPATPGFVDFGNGVAGDLNEVNMVASLGYTVDTTGMGRAMRTSESPWFGNLPGDPFDSFVERQAIDNADLILFSYVKSGDYRNDRYRETDDAFLDVQESWNGVETPMLSLGNGDWALGSGAGDPTPTDPGPLSHRFGWNEAGNKIANPVAINMQIEPDMLTHPFFQGLTMVDDPQVPGGMEVVLNDWTYTPALLGLGYVDGAAPPAASNNVDRGVRIVRRDSTDPSQGEAGDGPVPGATITSGFSDTGGYVVDYPKGTDFDVPDGNDDATNVPNSGTEFGIAGARRVMLPMWGYSIPITDPTGDHTWGQYQTADFFKLVDNVIAEMLLNPDGAPTLAGDFDSDGDVDGADFLVWQLDTSVGSLTDWRTKFGMTSAMAASTSAASVVPEPSSLALAAFSVLAMVSCPRRRHRQSAC